MRGIPYQPYQIVHAQLRLFKSVGAVGAGSGSKWIHVDPCGSCAAKSECGGAEDLICVNIIYIYNI